MNPQTRSSLVFLACLAITILIVSLKTKKRKAEFDAAKTHAVQIGMQIQANREMAQYRSDNVSQDGRVLYTPETAYGPFKNAAKKWGIVGAIVLLVVLYVIDQSRSVFWQLRNNELIELQPYLLTVLIVSIWAVCKFARPLSALKQQSLTVTQSEIVGHNGTSFLSAKLDDITSVYADYVKRSIKEGQYTDGRLVIMSKDMSIEFSCFKEAHNVANAINAILLRISEESISQSTQRSDKTEYHSENDNPLVRRAFLLLEDCEWDRADELLEQVLNVEPENARAYIGKLCVELRINHEDDLLYAASPIAGFNNFKRAYQFADNTYRAKLDMYARTQTKQTYNYANSAGVSLNTFVPSSPPGSIVCPNCGTVIMSQTAAFCGSCGISLSNSL